MLRQMNLSESAFRGDRMPPGHASHRRLTISPSLPTVADAQKLNSQDTSYACCDADDTPRPKIT